MKKYLALVVKITISLSFSVIVFGGLGFLNASFNPTTTTEQILKILVSVIVSCMVVWETGVNIFYALRDFIRE